MKTNKILFVFFLLLYFSIKGYTQIVFTENFEGGVLPTGWSFINESGAVNWTYSTGGSASHPALAHGGTKNALFFYGSYSGQTTKLVTSVLNLSGVNYPVLKFWHTQDAWGTDQDHLKIYYKTSLAGAWIMLASYSSEIINWTQESIVLPNKSATYYIAFEARTGYGYGVCVDDVAVEQTPVAVKTLTSLSINQASESYVLRGSLNNSIIRVDLDVAGNSGSIMLNSLEVNALNSNNSFVNINGVKLFATTTNSFSAANQVGTSQSLVAGKASFSSVNYELPPGISYLWITYDVASATLSDYIFDAYIDAGKININGTNYPATLQSPNGNRTLMETVFQDDFETDQGWVLTGEFERNSPVSLGGSYENADPANAYSGAKVLGTDLSGLGVHPGDYEPTIANHAYMARSPIIDCIYYAGTKLRFYRWLNVENWDKAYIDISNDSGATWQQIWTNPATINENYWSLQELDISNYADKMQGIIVRFSLGTTDGTNNCSGWNIDDVVLTGDFINPEISVQSIVLPASGCNHTNADSVKICVKNNGGLPTNDTLQVCFSPDGGSTIFYDTIFYSILPEDSLVFTFRHTVDLSLAGTFNFFAATLVPGDKFTSNDTLHKSVTSSPQFTIPYFENFENGQNGWFSDGVNVSWQFGKPSSIVINSATSGIKAWKTNLNGDYNSNEVSYVQSPCLNFSGITNPYISFNLWWKSEPVSDGASLLFSIDDGATWSVVGAYNDMLHWYNFDTITSLHSSFNFVPGWSYESVHWTKVQHQLPPVIANNPNVKFRLVFASNNLSTDEGFAFDDVAIFDNQPDIGAIAVTTPVSACDLTNHEAITAIIKNFGSAIYNTGDTIRAGLVVNGVQTAIDTIILNAPMEPGGTFIHVFTYHADLHLQGNYIIDVYTLLPGDLDAGNNSFSKTVANYGHPVVSILNLLSGYCNSAPDVSLTGSPAGGVFTGSGVSGNIFSPSSVLPASHQIIYTFSDAHGCANSDTSTTNILALPVVNFSGLAASYCANASNVSLTGSPSGGTFSGSGIVGNSFSSSMAGVGNHTILYLYTDNNSCSNSVSKFVDVLNLPIVDFYGLNAAYCVNAVLDTLVGVPSGGTFSGLGITGNIFDASVLGIGTHAILYIYSDSNNCTNSVNKSTDILSLPTVSFSGLAAAYCVNALNDTLVGAPSGGVFSGLGMFGNIFNPIISGVGNHSVTYLYTDASNCSNSISKNVDILGLPAVDFSGLNINYCVNASSVTLTGSPSGGIFSGFGITGNIFSASSAGAGNHSVIYAFTDGNNCTNIVSKNTDILNLPVLDFSGLNTQYCVNASDASLVGSPMGGVFSGSGVSGNMFSPAAAGLGNKTVSYAFTDGNNCSNSITKNTEILNLPIVDFSGLNASYCANSTDAILAGSPFGGSFSGDVVNSNVFSPTSAGVGNHNILYQFTDNNNCTNTIAKSTEVFALPTVNFSGLDTSYCINSSNVNLIGSPVGGTFSGSGISGNIFAPAIAGSGNVAISYQFTDNNACSNSITKSVNIHNLPTVNFNGLDTFYCTTSTNVSLTGVLPGGVFSGTGMVGNIFSPASAGVGNFAISYQITDYNNCTNIISKPVQISVAPNVSFTGLDSVYCLNSFPVNLVGSPVGGVFIGSGISGNAFNPAIANAGFHTITYQWSNNINCINSATKIVHILELPAVDFSGLDTAYCVNTSSSELVGISAGGVFSGSGIAGNFFSPNTSGVGNFTISYQITDIHNCSNSISKTVHVLELPVVDFLGLDAAYCIYPDQSIPLTGIPSGGVFSGPIVSDTLFATYLAGLGPTYVSYSYTDQNGCQNSITKNTVIYDMQQISFSGLDTAYCENYNSVELIGVPSGGTFTGAGITGNFFDPFTAGPGYYQIEYYYTFNGVCTSMSQHTVYVRGVQNTSISGLDSAYCKNANPDILTGLPTGGVFIGDGISANVFNPSQTSSQNINITYSYTNVYGCESHTVQHVDVFNLPTINFGGLNSNYCLNALPDTLFGNPSNGVFYGNAVAENTFNPSLAGIGQDTVYFLYTDLHGCTALNHQVTHVFDLPSVTMSGLDSAYCIGQAPSILHGIPTGGSFSGGSMSGNMFFPDNAGGGAHFIIYTYSDVNGCRNRDTSTTIVYNLPIVSTGIFDSTFCKGSMPVALVGSPVGGLFSGEGVVGNLFSPSIADTGHFYISYEFADLHSCKNSDSTLIFLSDPPTFAFAFDTLKGNFPFTISAPSGFDLYLWDDGSTQQTYTVANPGWYAVTVTSTTGCSAVDSVYIAKAIGIEELSELNAISVYPNPANNVVNIAIDMQNALAVNIEIVNSIGAVIYSKKVSPKLKIFESISLHEFACGIYSIKVSSQKHFTVRKLIVR